MKQYWVYMLSSGKNGTIYTGFTSNLIKRVWEHKNKAVEGFTHKYDVDQLVYFEEFHDVAMAIQREKRFKKYSRQWKRNLIEQNNPDWVDLYDEIVK